MTDAHTFGAVIEAGEGGGAFVVVPASVVEALGGRGRVAVRASFDGVAYTGSVVSMGGQKVLGLLKRIRAELCKHVGDTVDVAAALASRRRFDPAKGLAIGWLYGIARHKLARTLAHGRVEDRARRALGMAPLVLDDEAIELVVTAEGDVVELLHRLPADQRAAIEARVVDEQEYEQIAAATHTSEAVIRKRVSRGLASLRRKLEGRTP